MSILFRTTLMLALTLPAAMQAAPGAPAAQSTAQVRGLWIDVRTPEEFHAGHLPGAIHVPVQHIRTAIASVSPNKNAPLHLYCHSGRRAEQALQELKALGYTQVTNHGAYKGLLKKGVR